MWELPSVEGRLDDTKVIEAVRGFGLAPLRIAPLGDAKHIFTHVEWHMTCLLYTSASFELCDSASMAAVVSAAFRDVACGALCGAFTEGGGQFETCCLCCFGSGFNDSAHRRQHAQSTYRWFCRHDGFLAAMACLYGAPGTAGPGEMCIRDRP